ncbi:MAG: hypothetical protein AB7H80_14825, partial [Candidatus Kapaibacterium sp.]
MSFLFGSLILALATVGSIDAQAQTLSDNEVRWVIDHAETVDRNFFVEYLKIEERRWQDMLEAIQTWHTTQHTLTLAGDLSNSECIVYPTQKKSPCFLFS